VSNHDPYGLTRNAVDISAWLRELGLERYEQAFQKGEIDPAILPELTDADLKELGIPLGPRKQLLKAISALAAGTGPPSARDTRRPEAERRQLTVMFADLVGSTELAARLDPEDMGRLIRAYQDRCAQVVERWGGHVAKYMGDGVLAYFGWPQAHEDEAERAVRAGLELVTAVGRLRPGDEPLAARVGIATGLVMVGELIGEGAAREEAVVGETPNLAARLQALAKPGRVVISQATRRLVGGLFELADLGPARVKGFAAPLIAWRVAGETRTEGRFEARQTAGLTPLVGRDEEIALLLRRWQQAKDGEGHVVLLSGEPGIGKSRLVREVRARLKDEPHVRLLYQCSPHHTTSPLHPLIEQLERAAGIARDDRAKEKLDKLAALLARGTDRPEQAVPLIAALLGLPTEGRYPALDLTPQRQKQLTLAALLEQLEGLAATRPVLLAYEDMHWSDPTTQELLGLTIERLQRLPALLLITYRPEFSPPWPSQPHVSALALSRLGRREGAALVERVVGDKPLPPGARERDRSDRRRARPRVFPQPARRRGRPTRAGAAIRPRPAGCRRAGVPSRRGIRGDLQLQARPGPGRGLRHPAQITPPATPRPHRPDPGEALRGNGGEPAGTVGASLHGSAPSGSQHRWDRSLQLCAPVPKQRYG
jgi:class 3 adenylate cyclase